MGSLERPVARRRLEHDRNFHDADGARVRSDAANGATATQAALADHGCGGRNGFDRAADAATLDQLASLLAPVADRVLRQWRPQSGRAAALAFPRLSMD